MIAGLTQGIYDWSVMDNFAGPVCVTGASGYIGAWVVKLLLERGATVRATVRKPDDATKVGFLHKLAQGLPGTLELKKADLTDKGSFHEAVAGCEVVFHTASPFVVRQSKDPQRDLIEPAVQGTHNVLDAVDAAPSVRRVVLTSSIAAVYGDTIDVGGKVLNEDGWNTTSTLTNGAYQLSKTLAERAGWERAGAQSRWSLVAINPGFVLGPALDPKASGESVTFMKSMIDGTFAVGMPAATIAVVDVREVALAHLEAALRSDAEGRHILAEAPYQFLQLARFAAAAAGPGFKVPVRNVPKLVLYLVGPIVGGLSWDYISRNVGFTFSLDNSKSRAKLGIAYRPMPQTITDHVKQLIADGVVVARNAA